MNTTIESVRKELEDKSLSECLELVAHTLNEKNTLEGLALSHKTVNDLVTLFRSIAQYIEED